MAYGLVHFLRQYDSWNYDVYYRKETNCVRSEHWHEICYENKFITGENWTAAQVILIDDFQNALHALFLSTLFTTDPHIDWRIRKPASLDDKFSNPLTLKETDYASVISYQTAAFSNWFKFVMEILEQDQTALFSAFSAKDQRGNTPLHYLFKYISSRICTQVDVVLDYLLQKAKLTPNQQKLLFSTTNNDGENLFHITARRCLNTPLIEKMVTENQFVLLQCNREDETAIHVALRKQHFDLAKTLIEQLSEENVDQLLKIQDRWGHNILSLAMQQPTDVSQRTKFVNFLRKKATNSALRQAAAKTTLTSKNALHYACRSSCSEVVRAVNDIFIDYRNELREVVSQKDNRGQTVTQTAEQYCESDIVLALRMLSTVGTNTTVKSHPKQTMLNRFNIFRSLMNYFDERKGAVCAFKSDYDNRLTDFVGILEQVKKQVDSKKKEPIQLTNNFFQKSHGIFSGTQRYQDVRVQFVCNYELLQSIEKISEHYNQLIRHLNMQPEGTAAHDIRSKLCPQYFEAKFLSYT